MKAYYISPPLTPLFMGNLMIMDTPTAMVILILNIFCHFFAFFSVHDLNCKFWSDNFEETLTLDLRRFTRNSGTSTLEP